jgi:hypothetical protein
MRQNGGEEADKLLHFSIASCGSKKLRKFHVLSARIFTFPQ